MSDTATTGTEPAATTTPVPASGMSWAEVANTALHYIGGGALIAASIYAAGQKLIDPSVCGMLILGGAAALGFKFTKQ